MGSIERLPIVRLGPSDAAEGLALSTEAQWNQNEADWSFFLAHGFVYGVRDGENRLIATAALLPHSPTDAWISMVLVTASWRRRGLATRLVDCCLAKAAELKLTTWLDATPAGAAVYGRMGFSAVLELRRLRLQVSRPKISAAWQVVSVQELAARDCAAMGFDRARLIGELCGRPGSRLASNGEALALVRDGRVARHIGPLFAAGSDSALALVDQIATREDGPMLIDAVATRRQFLHGLAARGWSTERPFQRMRFGGPAMTANPKPPFAVAGPEYG